MAALQILIGDDHTLVRQALRRILEDQDEWHVVAEAGDGREVVRLAVETHPDVAILDVTMPGMNGFEAASELSHRAPDIPVLILSMHGDDVSIRRALQAGARGYLLKDSTDDDLLAAVAAVAAGQSYFSPAVATVIVNDYARQSHQNRASDPLGLLSDREREVFQLISEGRPNRQIADLLGIRPTTVETHRARVLHKLNLHSAAELVLFAVRHGLVSRMPETI